MHFLKTALLLLALATQAQMAVCQAAISVRDDAGNTVTLARPAQRVITLAPHATELVFAAGGGDRIVGRVSHSDYPPQANRIALVGDSRQIDLERVMALKPDLVIAWMNGNSQRQLDQLRQLGIPLFYSEPRKLDDIPDSIEQLGLALGSSGTARPAAAALRHRLQQLRQRYGSRPPVRSFYQIWDQPLYTLNGEHIVSDALRLCGGENVFAHLQALAPSVGTEAVLQADPEVIFSGERGEGGGGVGIWRAYPGLTAVRRDNLFTIDSDLTSRPGPRLVDGAQVLCEKLELARTRRKERP